jgi:hypothetical protein
VSWKVGCTVSTADPRRCSTTVTNSPTWVGVALGVDEDVPVPATLEVLFGVEREGRGAVSGRELSCGTECESLYAFGEREDLRARPASGWRFGGWIGACGRVPTCGLHVGPVTTIGARFVENLVPRLLGVTASGRRVTVRLSVRHRAQARVQVRRAGSAVVLAQRRFEVGAGTTSLAVPLPPGTRPGRVRVALSVSDGMGGGRAWTRVVRVGP